MMSEERRKREREREREYRRKESNDDVVASRDVIQSADSYV
jgi:hypothetical protein